MALSSLVEEEFWFLLTKGRFSFNDHGLKVTAPNAASDETASRGTNATKTRNLVISAAINF